MRQVSVLFGGAAGDGVRGSGRLLARIMSRYGWRSFVYDDYQSLIRGGHNFSIVTSRKDEKVLAHWSRVDAVVALNQDTIDKHKDRLRENGVIIYDADRAKKLPQGVATVAVNASTIVREKRLAPIYRNALLMGALLKVLGVPLEEGLKVYEKAFGPETPNKQLLQQGYTLAEPPVSFNLSRGSAQPLPVLTGNEAVALGLLRAGLKVYLAYPMTPSTSILHTLAALQDRYGVLAYQPENEISVINMALGAAYAGARTAVGTSGGGFALMTEAFSLAGQSETPIVVVVSQRPGPATGVPTYTAQGDLAFVLNAGHGEFPRVVLAPGDVEEAFYMAADALNLAWKWQVPVVLLIDKHLSESPTSVEIDEGRVTVEEGKVVRSREELERLGLEAYKRYLITGDGVSPMALPGIEGVVVKANSYEHDEWGLTTEDPVEISRMVDKRMSKLPHIVEDLRARGPVRVWGDAGSRKAVVSWGSTKGAILEALRLMGGGFKFVQVRVLAPFPGEEVARELEGADVVVDVENNRTAPLADLVRLHAGVRVDGRVLKYDGRPFTPDELAARLSEVMEG